MIVQCARGEKKKKETDVATCVRARAIEHRVGGRPSVSPSSAPPLLPRPPPCYPMRTPYLQRESRAVQGLAFCRAWDESTLSLGVHRGVRNMRAVPGLSAAPTQSKRDEQGEQKHQDKESCSPRPLCLRRLFILSSSSPLTASRLVPSFETTQLPAWASLSFFSLPLVLATTTSRSLRTDFNHNKF